MTCHHWGPVSRLHLQTSHLRDQQKKKRALQPSTTHYCSHSSGSIPALLLSLPNALESAHMLDHCRFPGTYNEEQLVQHLLCGLSRMRCFLHGL